MGKSWTLQGQVQHFQPEVSGEKLGYYALSVQEIRKILYQLYIGDHPLRPVSHIWSNSVFLPSRRLFSRFRVIAFSLGGMMKFPQSVVDACYSLTSVVRIPPFFANSGSSSGALRLPHRLCLLARLKMVQKAFSGVYSIPANYGCIENGYPGGVGNVVVLVLLTVLSCVKGHFTAFAADSFLGSTRLSVEKWERY